MALVDVHDLEMHFPRKAGLLGRKAGAVRAVDGVSLSIETGETLGLVGESGCGKSTLGRCIVRLVEPTAGRVTFEGKDLLAMGSASLRQARRHFQTIFQDPYASLNPRLRIGDSIAEGLKIHSLAAGAELREIAEEMLVRVGLRREQFGRYPHEFSGGQRQRIAIARALVTSPKFIVADEAVSALDVSIQAQILNLLRELRQSFGLTFLFISHDLRVVRYFSNRIAVMYLGKLVESAPAAELFREPIHPYTRALLSAIPTVDRSHRREREILAGDVPSPVSPPSGCRFHPRCRFAKPICREIEPQLKMVGPRREVACHVFGSAD